ncbi:hypothetical protein [Gorillibacterium sp. CAU 1737]|uniref:hypothetical protein n=1 Tax=Gorillibacterium sp. CAU 1737 TaxID=3140362 RepID=UPI003261C791
MTRSRKRRVLITAMLGLAVVVLAGGESLPEAKAKGLQASSIANTAIVEAAKKETKEEIAAIWANALKTRDGKPRFERMSESAKDKFIQEQIARSGEDWNFVIGVSSPWVVEYEVEISGMTAAITYRTQTSEPAAYETRETLTFAETEHGVVVDDYQTEFEDVPVK